MEYRLIEIQSEKQSEKDEEKQSLRELQASKKYTNRYLLGVTEGAQREVDLQIPTQ